MKTEKELYGLETCLDSIDFQVKDLGYDPIRLLGKYILRAEQDPFFNTTMVTAIKKYIKDNDIKWSYEQ